MTRFSWCLDGWSSLMWRAVTSPSRTEWGTMIKSVDGDGGSVRWTTNSPSLAIEATLRYLFTSLMLVCFLDVHVPCLRWACVRRRSGHHGWIWAQADLVVNGRRDRQRISCTDVERTTESSMRATKLQIWHLGSLHSAALRLEKSKGTFMGPARCRMLTWYLLMVNKNDVTRGLPENSLRHSLSMAWTHGLLWVSKHACWVDWMRNGLKCSTAVAMLRASTSHGRPGHLMFSEFRTEETS